MEHVKGNAVTAVINGEIDALAHCCNCHNTFGAGIAKEIKRRIPSAYKADTLFHTNPYIKEDPRRMLGDISCNYGSNERVYNLYGQFGYGHGRHLNYAAFASSMIEAGRDLVELAEPEQKVVIGVPYLIGCGLAGGDWDLVSEILNDVESKFKNQLLIRTYELEV